MGRRSQGYLYEGEFRLVARLGIGGAGAFRSQTLIAVNFPDPANVLTLSCKSRPPRRPLESGTTAAATNTKWQDGTAAGVTRACSSEPPEGGSAAETKLGGVCQLVRAVRRPRHVSAVVEPLHVSLWLTVVPRGAFRVLNQLAMVIP